MASAGMARNLRAGILRRMLAALLLVLGAARPAVAVLVDGPPESTGALQSALLSRIAELPDVSVRPLDAVAKAAGAQSQGLVTQLDREKADGLLAAARHASAEDRISDALAALASLEAVQDESGTTPI